MIKVMIMRMNYNDNNNYDNDIFTNKHNSLYNNDEDIDHAITISLIIISIRCITILLNPDNDNNYNLL